MSLHAPVQYACIFPPGNDHYLAYSGFSIASALSGRIREVWIKFDVERKITSNVVGFLRSLASPQRTTKLEHWSSFKIQVLNNWKSERDLMALKTVPTKAITADATPPTIKCSSGIIFPAHLSTLFINFDDCFPSF